ncbi:MAG: hypothetical protein OHK0046_11750 [Anaerolineae bacterium]
MVATLVPTSTVTPFPTASATPAPLIEATPEITPEVTEQVVEVPVEPAEGQGVPAPLTLDLPDGWRSLSDTVVVQDVDTMRVIPFTVYTGPVTGGTGFITVLYGFPSILPTQGTVTLGSDGLRLLRLAVTDLGCNIGVDAEADQVYTVGDQVAVGSYFSAVDCPESPDTRGWFAVLNYDNVNIAFYMYAEPISAMDGSAEAELQAILNTVRFDLSGIMVTATAAP